MIYSCENCITCVECLETSDKPKLKDILPNNWLVRLKKMKEDEESQRD